MSVKKNPVINKGMVHFFLILGGITMVLPFFWMLTTSLKADELIFKVPPIWIPRVLHFENYTRALEFVPMIKYFINTFTNCFTKKGNNQDWCNYY